MTRSKPSSCKLGDSSCRSVQGLCACVETHLEHGLDTSVTNLRTSRSNVFPSVVPKARLDQLLSVLYQEVPNGLITDGSNLDQLCETVSDLSNGESLEEGEVEEGVEGCVVCSETRVSSTCEQNRNTHRFLSFLWLIPTLMETLASIRPIKVVGIRMKLDVRR